MLMSVETPFNWDMLLEHCKFWKNGPVSNFFIIWKEIWAKTINFEIPKPAKQLCGKHSKSFDYLKNLSSKNIYLLQNRRGNIVYCNKKKYKKCFLIAFHWSCSFSTEVDVFWLRWIGFEAALFLFWIQTNFFSFGK